MLIWNYPSAHSTAFNLSWLFQYQRQFLAGQFYPRWLEFSNFGFGNATFAFYPPLCMVATLPFRALGVSPLNSLIASMGVAIFLFGAGLYRYIHQFYPGWIALTTAVVGMISPYFTVNIYERGAIAEVWAIAIIPWILLASYHTIERANRFPDSTPQSKLGSMLARWGLDPDWDILALTLAYSLLVLSHLPTLLLFSLVWIWLPWWMAKPGRRIAAALRCYGALGLACGVTAFFLVPVLLDGKLVQLEALHVNGRYLPQNRLIVRGLRNLKPRFTGNAGIDRDLIQPWLTMFALTFGASVGFIAKQFGWLPRRKSDRSGSQKRVVYWIIVSIIALAMTTDLAVKVYQNWPTLQRIQFSWRWLSLLTVFLPLLFADGLSTVKHWLRKTPAQKTIGGIGGLALVVLMAIYSIQGAQEMFEANYDRPVLERYAQYGNVQPFPVPPAPDNVEQVWLVHYWSDDNRVWFQDVLEYRARGIDLSLPPERPYPLLEWEDGSQNNLTLNTWEFGRRVFIAQNNTNAPKAVRLKTFYYPAWFARFDEGPWQSVDLAEDGQLSVNIEPGEHRVEIAYRGTKADGLGRLISVVSLGAIAGMALVRYWPM